MLPVQALNIKYYLLWTQCLWPPQIHMLKPWSILSCWLSIGCHYQVLESTYHSQTCRSFHNMAVCWLLLSLNSRPPFKRVYLIVLVYTLWRGDNYEYTRSAIRDHSVGNLHNFLHAIINFSNAQHFPSGMW